MFSNSAIAPETVRAFLETEYHVLAEIPFILRVGVASAELQKSHERQKVCCSAFLTACNPFSKAFDTATNAVRQSALAGEISRRRLPCLQGIGKHPCNDWPGEASILVFGLELDAARTLAMQFEQNALVWSDADCVPQLILLR